MLIFPFLLLQQKRGKIRSGKQLVVTRASEKFGFILYLVLVLRGSSPEPISPLAGSVGLPGAESLPRVAEPEQTSRGGKGLWDVATMVLKGSQGCLLSAEALKDLKQTGCFSHLAHHQPCLPWDTFLCPLCRCPQGAECVPSRAWRRRRGAGEGCRAATSTQRGGTRCLWLL